jgi:hypothetical protein
MAAFATAMANCFSPLLSGVWLGIASAGCDPPLLLLLLLLLLDNDCSVAVRVSESVELVGVAAIVVGCAAAVVAADGNAARRDGERNSERAGAGVHGIVAPCGLYRETVAAIDR